VKAEGGGGKGGLIRKAAIALAAVLVLTAAWWAFLGSGGGKRPSPPLPVPNGFDDLVRAGEMVRLAVERDPGAVPAEELRAIVAGHREALASPGAGWGGSAGSRRPASAGPRTWSRSGRSGPS